ncbi:MAG: hypothetical protein ABI461_11340 [Polyangiaceae bacterium]
MTRLLVLTIAMTITSAFLCGCPDDKATADTKGAAAASAAPAPAASAKPAAKGGW